MVMKHSVEFSAKAGFTLIETLIVIGIMGMLSAMLLAYNHSSTTQLALTVDQASVAGALNRAKALALEKYSPNLGGSVIACAYGVHFTTSSYTIYGVLAYNNCNGVTNYAYSGSLSQINVQTLKLDAGLIFASGTPTDIYFIPPYLEAKSSPAGAMTVTIQILATGATAQVSVSPGGGVSF
jgi:prepilin-type N-terminal cleavage/methylation domain-containing protein